MQVSFRLDAVRDVLGWTGDPSGFREGVLLAWKGTAAHGIVQILSMNPKAVFPEAKLPSLQAAQWQTAPEGW